MAMVGAGYAASETASMGGGGRNHGARQPVGLLQDVTVFRLLPREEADGHKQRAEHRPHQHDPAVGVFVGGVE